MSEYAVIKNGVVEGTYVASAKAAEELFVPKYDYVICVDEIKPKPGLGWLYDGENFINPDLQPKEISNA